MNKEYSCKSFQELTVEELYACLRLRSEVFVLEQDCVYQDMDDKDQKSHHLLLYANGQLAGYCRLLPAGVSYTEISIGRVITSLTFRGTGLGRKLMEYAIEACYVLFGRENIRISAQVYALPFYESLGFEPVGSVYEEDGIPHQEMLCIPSITQ